MSYHHIIIDTNIILSYPDIINRIKHREVDLGFDPSEPLTITILEHVIQELDNFKKGDNELARNSRAFSRDLLKLFDDNTPKRNTKPLKKRSFLTLVLNEKTDIRFVTKNDAPETKDLHTDDALIAYVIYYIPSGGLVLSHDMNVRIKAFASDIESRDYSGPGVNTHKNTDAMYSGNRTITISPELITRFKDERFLPLEDFVSELDSAPFDNEYITLLPNKTLARFSSRKNGLVPLISNRDLFGVFPKNDEQKMAIDALLNDDVQLVSLVGKAGTGKTLLAIACGLSKIQGQDANFTRMLVSRPIQPMGKDLGFLPGDINEKMGPWMQPIFDNLEFLCSNRGDLNYEEYLDDGRIQVEPLTYIRGRTIPRQYMIVDEAQNLTPHEIKTIITRAGEGTKIVLTGDCDQIDSPYLDSMSNGLAYVIERLKDEVLVSHVTLVNGERSPLSEMASKKL